MPEVIGENIDRLVSIEMRYRQGLPRGVSHLLYNAARKAQGGLPLSLLAASRLQQAVRPGQAVLMVTGAGFWPWLPFGETDGPPGAAALARALSIGLDARPVFVTEQEYLAPISAAVRATGLVVADRKLWAARSGCALMEVFPRGTGGGEATRRLLDEYRPAAIIFVEKIGPNDRGVWHSIMGSGSHVDINASVHLLVAEARERHILTVGIGDGGNEIGFGKVARDVADIQPYGARCQCACGGGVATAIETDVLVSAAISNWGAYGVAASLASLLGKPEVLHDERTEAAMIEQCALAGGTDGIMSTATPFVDGVPVSTNLAVIRMLHTIIDLGMREFTRPF